jgi:hypothetical protein
VLAMRIRRLNISLLWGSIRPEHHLRTSEFKVKKISDYFSYFPATPMGLRKLQFTTKFPESLWHRANIATRLQENETIE